MNLAGSLSDTPWLGWALALIVGYPLVVVALSEVLQRLEERGRLLGAPVRHLRNVTLPLIALQVFLQQLVGLPSHDTTVKVAYTLTLTSLFFALLSLANVVLFAEARPGSWRARVPKLFLDLSRAFFVLIGLSIVLAFVWEQDLRGLFAALGIGSLVIGLALQDTLGNLISGVAILFENPFSVGDFIRIGEREGRVVEMTWRTTRLHAGGTNSIHVIPNLVLGKEQIVNLSRPGIHVVRVPLRFSPDDAPNAVKAALLETVGTLPGVLDEPPPGVTTVGYGETGIDYELAFAVPGYGARGRARDELMTRLWYVVRRQGLHLPSPVPVIGQPSTHPEAEGVAARDGVQAVLAGIPVLQALPEDTLADLTACAVVRRFARNEIVLREGDSSATLFVIASGEALLGTRDASGVEREVMRLSRGDFIGIRQVLLRQPSSVNIHALTDLVLVAIPDAAAGRMLDRSPRLASDLGEAQEARRKATLLAKQGHGPPVG